MSNGDTQVMEVTQQPETMNPTDVLAQVQLIQHIIKSVMKKGLHYGVIPGCGDKPTLLKPGAEKLLMTFRLAADVHVTDLHMPEDDYRAYRVHCPIRSLQTDKIVGTGVGECGSREEKFAWRKAVSQEEFDATDPDKRRIKYKSKPPNILQIAQNPHDQANTCLKIARKRAMVDGTITSLSAGDIFYQDIEDLENPTGVRTARSKPATDTKPEPQPMGFGNEAATPLSNLTDESLQWYLRVIQENIADKAKAKFLVRNTKKLKDLMQEMDNRIEGVESAQGYDESQEDYPTDIDNNPEGDSMY